MEFPREKTDPKEASPQEKGGISFKDLKELLKKPPAEAEQRVETREKEAAAAPSAEALYQKALLELEQVIKTLLEDKRPDLSALSQIVADCVAALSAGSQLLIISFSYPEAAFYSFLHAVNTTVLAIKLGMGLGYEKEDLIKLGMAALLHDVGMWKISQDIILKEGPLAPPERAEMRRHVAYSQILLSALPPGYEWLRTIAEQTHERENGSGYPKGLKGDEIHEHAKIIGLIDAYEAMTHHRPYRTGGYRTSDDALKELIHVRETQGYSWDLVKTLVRQVTVFPPGSFVRLNSGEIAQVLEINPLAPLRPRVEVCFDAAKKRLKTPKVIDLDQDTLVYITASILPTELPKKE